jgi:hypothetical protein
MTNNLSAAEMRAATERELEREKRHHAASRLKEQILFREWA